MSENREVRPRNPANREWLQSHIGEYQGQWLALRNGELLGVSSSLENLVEQVSRDYGIAFPSREVMLTAGY